MKILHTSDWHIGKQLHKIDLNDDIELFLNWLVDYLEAESIDVLLMSGDLFDHSNPSTTSLKIYYQFLKKCVSIKCKIIITGGNHDSAAVLNAPKELLELFDISIIGGATKMIVDTFIEVVVNEEKLLVAATPFLKEKDLRKTEEGETYADKIEKIKKGLENYYTEINTHFDKNYTDELFIVMGHLFVQGSEPSDSERDIQIGNQAAVSWSIFGDKPSYVALGHIHKPQRIGGNETIRYCGSPISLSFSEKEDKKQVLVIETKSNKITAINTVATPCNRELKNFSGTYNEVVKKLENYTPNYLLPSLVELNIEEADYSITVLQNANDLVQKKMEGNFIIIKHKVTFKNQLQQAGTLVDINEQLEDFKPIQLFEKRLNLEGDLVNKEELMNAFRELLESTTDEN